MYIIFIYLSVLRGKSSGTFEKRPGDNSRCVNPAPDGNSAKSMSIAHDFLTPQPIKNARVYFMCMIMHDWPDSTCIQILKQLRTAAGPETEVIIIDNLVDYACLDTTIDKDILGMGSKHLLVPW